MVGVQKGEEYEKKKDDIEREHWSQESLEWEQKLNPVADAIEKTDMSTREKIWDKFDRKKVEKLDCDKSLSRLIYSLLRYILRHKIGMLSRLSLIH